MRSSFVKNAKKTLITGLACLGLSGVTLTVKATGVPTVDVAAIAQAIQQVLMLQQQYD